MGDLHERFSGFRDSHLNPLFDYIDEALDDADIILGTLHRYKQKVEWYRRKEVQEILQSDSQNGEKKLAQHMYEFLFDQGLPFQVEPKSASGRPDVVSLDSSTGPLIGEVKILDQRGPSYIIKGFHQIYRYCVDYNQSVGYLVVFNNTDKQLRVDVPSEQGIPRFTYNHKTIFFVVIDIYEHQGTASQRGISETITISNDELVREVKTDSDPPAEAH